MVYFVAKFGILFGVVVNVLRCNIAVSEFELQSRYFIHFMTDPTRKGMNLLILPALGSILLLLFFYKGGVSIE